MLSLIHDDIICVKAMLEYIVSRISSKENIYSSIAYQHFDHLISGQASRGHFFNLNCGHNAMPSETELNVWQKLVGEACAHQLV